MEIRRFDRVPICEICLKREKPEEVCLDPGCVFYLMPAQHFLKEVLSRLGAVEYVEPGSRTCPDCGGVGRRFEGLVMCKCGGTGRR